MSMKSMGEIGQMLNEAAAKLKSAKTLISQEDTVDRGDTTNLAYLSTHAAEATDALQKFDTELARVLRRAAGRHDEEGDDSSGSE